MIREAGYKDVPALCTLLRDFTLSSSGADVPEDEFEGAVLKLIEKGVALVSDDGTVKGMLLGQVFFHPFWQQTFLQEVAWFSHDKSGYALLQAFIRKANELDVDAVYFSVLEPVSDRMDKVLTKRLGFDRVERSYIMTK